MARIVVGYDGSPGAEQALAWAAREAELKKAELVMVCAWRLPLAVGPFAPEVLEYLQHAMETTAAKGRDRMLRDHDVPEVTTALTDTHPAAALVAASRDADLLVVGSHGHGTIAGLLLGSVSLHCVTHAACPVVVVRPPTAVTGES